MNIKLRQWQTEALQKSLDWLLDKENNNRHFLINAAPGAGKTLASCAIAQKLIDLNEIERIIVIAPRSEVVNQWANDFRHTTGRHMHKVTGADNDVEAMGTDVCATWAAIQGLLPEFQAVCQASKTLVICDEHHHAAVKAAWGEGADGAFADARYVLVLTGTPIRSDGAESIWMAYDDKGAINHPEAGTYVLNYGQAVDLGYCRPVTFHRHEGRFRVDIDGESIQVSGEKPAQIDGKLKQIPGLQNALDFYKLAKTPQFEKDNRTPLKTGYQASMLEWGIAKLNDLRHRMPDAGGLVIAPTIEVAEYMVDLLEMLEGERPVLVHSQLPNAGSKISAFRNTDKRWMVSVAMVSEGVDIKRLRVLVYLPNALTELAFRQAVGRVVRTMGRHDDTRAYVILPAFERFELYATRVELEMPNAYRKESTVIKKKRCRTCGTECDLGASHCHQCGDEFPVAPTRTKPCPECGAENALNVDRCHSCGASMTNQFSLTLDEALRTGAIVRGVTLDEDEVAAAEQIAETVRRRVLRSGDQQLIKLLQSLPEESWDRLRVVLGS